MKKLLLYLCLCLLASCNCTPSQEAKQVVLTTGDTPHLVGGAEATSSSFTEENKLTDVEIRYETETETFYIVIADTSNSYKELQHKMFVIHSFSKIPIDTMRRTYDTSKNLIALPEDDEDEMYAGDYLPRRFPSNTLSVEYLIMYQQNAGNETMALVAGIYEHQSSADSAVFVIKQLDEKAFVVKTDMYVGCVH